MIKTRLSSLLSACGHRLALVALGICLAALLIPDSVRAQFAPPEGPMPNPPWENPHVNGRNRLPARATLHPFATPKQALQRESSPWVKSLNGSWAFSYTSTPAEAPSGFYRPETSVAEWDRIPVPSNWKLEGYRVPIYAGYAYPFNPVAPPSVRYDTNAVGSYRRSFTLPDDWTDRRVLLHLGGVSSAVQV